MDQLDPRHRLLALCAVKGVSWSLLAREAQRGREIANLLRGEIWEESGEADLARQLLIRALLRPQPLAERVEAELRVAESVGAELVTVLDDAYPANLRLIYNLPPFLFIRGALMVEDAYAVAVVGTRQASERGLRQARRMARALTQEGVTVVSGLAAGIDTAAHQATLEAGGRTIAVLGTGVAHNYPRENAGLAERIAEQGAIVSQFWPSTRPSSYTFPRRNIVTSGISQGTVVIEATATSGAKLQARRALEHGKQVFLLHSLVTDQPWAQRYLAQRGAVEVADVSDVIGQLRSTPDMERLATGRRQLAFDLG
jgi:DNA processing protein